LGAVETKEQRRFPGWIHQSTRVCKVCGTFPVPVYIQACD
jgi:hypothetical protein